MVSLPHDLRRLARLYGVQTAFHGIDGQHREATPEVLMSVLRMLDAPIERPEQARELASHRRAELWLRPVPPVLVCWDDGGGRSPHTHIKIRLSQRCADAVVRAQLTLDGGPTLDLSCPAQHLPHLATVPIDGVSYGVKALTCPTRLPHGYHSLRLEIGGRVAESLVIVAPMRAYRRDTPEAPRRDWGAFMPIYALHAERSWGGGDLADYGSLLNWTRQLGATMPATLPLHAAFLDEPTYEYSPYAPASRLMWNEFYVDVTQTEEWEHTPQARQLLESADAQATLSDLRSAPRVDYRRQMALKRRVLELLAHTFHKRLKHEREAFDAFIEAHPQVPDYARFRATMELRRAPWPNWPHPIREGELTQHDYREATARYHVYAQWVAHRQMSAMADHARNEGGTGLYLDMPLGVHSDSYDVWRHQDLFARDAAGGAPPDDFFAGGQNWGFPPMHPEAVRRDRYRYVIDGLRRLMRHAGTLRIDHVMGLHRLFWIPRGAAAHEGMYVHYSAEDMYAILALESHRHRTELVGEDLGTVPDAVRRDMRRHGLRRMYVLQFNLRADENHALADVEEGMAACVNTHDTPTFAGFWTGADIDDRVALGLLDEDGRRREREWRETLKASLIAFLQRRRLLGKSDAIAEIHHACLKYLAGSRAGTVLVNLEDLWEEPRPQNVPGTWRERPNWLRKAAHPLERITWLETCDRVLRSVDRLRRKGTSEPDKSEDTASS